MRRIRPAGVLVLAMLLVSAGVTALGAGKLLSVEETIDDGARTAKTILVTTRAEGGAVTSGEDAYPGDVVGVLTFFGDEDETAPIYYGTDADVLERGVGLAEETGVLNKAGNAVLFGHRDSALKALSRAAPGDAVHVETASGVRAYVIERVYVTTPDDPHIYDEADDVRLTMVTCYPFSFVGPAPERFVAIAAPVGVAAGQTY